MRQMKWFLVMFAIVTFLGCTGRQSRILDKAEALSLNNPDSAMTLLSQIDSTTLSEDGHFRYDLVRALVYDEQWQLCRADTVSCLSSADSTAWIFNRTTMSMYRKTADKAPIADSTLLNIYHYYEHTSLGGTVDDKETLQSFGRICLVLSSQYHEEDLQQKREKFLHLAIHCAEAADDHALAYRAYRLLGQHSKDVMLLICLTRALHHYRQAPDNMRWLLTLLNDYGYYALLTGPFDLHHFPSLERITAVIARHQGATATQAICDTVFQGLDSLWALPAPNYAYAFSNIYTDNATNQMYKLSVPIDKYEEAQRSFEENGKEKYHPDFRTVWKKAVSDFNTAHDTYLSAGYVMKTASLQRRLMTSIIVILLLSLLLLFLLFRNWRNKTRQRHEAERIAHQQEAEQMTERLRQKDSRITMLRRHIMDKNEILEMLEPTAGKRTIINARDWHEIEVTLDIADNQFVSRLRRDHPDFSEDDIRLCMLSRMKLSNTALSAIYVISISAVQHRKQRLKRNGFGVTDSNISFDQVIANF